MHNRPWMWGRSACRVVGAVLSFIVIGCGATSAPSDATRSGVSAASAGRAQESAWLARAPMPTARTQPGVAAQGSSIYVVGGYAQTAAGEGFTGALEVYDVVEDKWTTRAPMPTPRNSLGAVFVGGKLYAIGGWTEAGAPTDVVEVYDRATDTWTTKTPMPVPRNAFGIAEYDGRIYVVGGWLGDGPGLGFTAAVDVYVPATDTWFAGEPLPSARNSLAAAFLGGRLYAIGGTDAEHGFLDLVDSYDPATNTWRSEPPLLFPRNQHAAVRVADAIIVVGGQNWEIIGPFIATVEAYAPAAGRWYARGPLADARLGLGAVAVAGTVYAIGGWHFVEEGDAAAATVEQYAYPNATVMYTGDICVLWTLEDPGYAHAEEMTVLVPQTKRGPVVVTCKGMIGNPTGEQVVVRSEDAPGVPCVVVNDWLPLVFDWVETISPNGEATIVCRY